MKRKYQLFISLLFCILLLPGILQAEQKGLIWEVSSKDTRAYIVGSVHLFKEALYPLNEQIEKSFQESEVAVFEVDMKEMDSGLLQFQQKGLYPEGDSLDKHISKETLDILLPRLSSYGIPFEIAKRFRPWMLAMTIQSIEYQKLGFRPEFGIDRYFYEKAKDKEIKGLESIEYQLGLFDSLSDHEQEIYLLYTILEIEKTSSYAETIIKAWVEGNLKILEEIIYQPLKEKPELLPIYKRLFLDRNRAMVSKIEDFLKTKKRYFIVVGAGHLAGEEGIIELLKKKGYRIRQL